METEKDPFEAVRAMMHENLEKVGGATQSYLDMLEKTLRGFPGANQEQIGTFKAYIERQAAANRDFVEKLLSAKDFQEAFRLPHSGRILSVPVESLRGGCNSDWRKDGWLVQTNGLRASIAILAGNNIFGGGIAALFGGRLNYCL